MSANAWLVLDIATASIEGAVDYLEPVEAPSHYKKPEAIEKYIAEETAKRVEKMATDLDLARITGIGTQGADYTQIELCRTEDDEAVHLAWLADEIRGATVVSYNGRSFDWPLLMRRARYLGVDFPTINTDRYKSPHLDLMDLLSDRDPSRRRSLGFYVKRLGMDLTKPLSGAEEAKVHETGNWDGLEQSLAHDVEATYRLGTWMGVL